LILNQSDNRIVNKPKSVKANDGSDTAKVFDEKIIISGGPKI
jgi:hypothetical protein